MTSDAKVGLLLGLVFIFIIAFIINGLPTFRKDANNNQLTDNMINLQNGPLAARQRKITREVMAPATPTLNQSASEVVTAQTSDQDVRFTTPIPASPQVVDAAKEAVEAKPQPLPVVKAPADTAKPALTKVYVVREGDSLAGIAKMFYGPEDGKKTATIIKIFEANRSSLKSPDQIYAGQKLVLPQLSVSNPNQGKLAGVLSGKIFEKVKSIGQKRLLPGNNNTPIAKQGKWVVVKEGDNLWRIASEQLGDGNRYTEIAELNADIIKDTDNMAVGTRLKMPPR